MAEIKSFPNNQDVYVGAEWVMKWLHGRTSGVFGAENNLSISIVPDSMSVEVSDGVGWLSNANGDGIVFWNDSEQSNGSKLRLTHDAADGVLDRIDRIVATWETTNYVALPTISILKGIASNMPIPPILTNSTTQRQISIASVKIPAGAISLSASMVTDERLNSDVCGIVTETIKVDTSTMQSQFEALLNAIQLELQNLKDGTASLLKTGGTMSGPINMNGQKLHGLNAPTANDQAANMGYVHQQMKKAAPRNLLDNSDFTNPVNQRGITTFAGADGIINGYVALDRWLFYGTDTTFAVTADGISAVNGGAATCGIAQRVEPGAIKAGKKYTLAFKGIVTGTVNLSYGINATTNTESQLVEAGVDKIHAFTFTAGDSTANGMYNIRIRSSNVPSTMDVEWIALYEGEYNAETLPEYQPKGYMVEALNCGALTVHKTLDIPASGWSSITPYTQTVSLEGVSAEDIAHVSPIYSETLATALAQQEAWGMVSRAKTAANAITFYCFDEKPTTDISVQIEVNR